jgi:LmbE family N-acetylglucosaminyl deacetylase
VSSRPDRISYPGPGRWPTPAMRVAVIGAHHDDELLGAGATLAMHVRSGAKVHAAVVCDGPSGRRSRGVSMALERDGQRAAEIMGFASLRFLGLPGQRLDTVPAADLTELIEELLDDIRPHQLYTHVPDDVNVDHGLVSRAAWRACRPDCREGLLRFAAFESPSSAGWAWAAEGTGLRPNLFVDVADTLDTKIAALECYETKMRDYPHPRSAQALRERAAFWGSHTGCGAAEPFRILRQVE